MNLNRQPATRMEYQEWRTGFIEDFTRDFNSPDVQELLPIYHNDIYPCLRRYAKVISQEEKYFWRCIAKIIRLEMFVYCPEEYKIPGHEEYKFNKGK